MSRSLDGAGDSRSIPSVTAIGVAQAASLLVTLFGVRERNRHPGGSSEGALLQAVEAAMLVVVQFPISDARTFLRFPTRA